MAVMASWNGKTWGVSSQRIAALNGVSSSVELDTENSDDKAGSPATKTKALKLQSMSFDFDLASAVGGDARGEFERPEVHYSENVSLSYLRVRRADNVLSARPDPNIPAKTLQNIPVCKMHQDK